MRQFRVNFERFRVNVTLGAVTPLQLPNKSTSPILFSSHFILGNVTW